MNVLQKAEELAVHDEQCVLHVLRDTASWVLVLLRVGAGCLELVAISRLQVVLVVGLGVADPSDSVLHGLQPRVLVLLDVDVQLVDVDHLGTCLLRALALALALRILEA